MRLACVQPRSSYGPDEYKNVDQALVWVKAAAEAQADLVLFPEGYPGPTNPRNSYDARGPLSDAAREYGIHIVAGGLEEASGGGYHVVLHFFDDSGTELGPYYRMTPAAPYDIYSDIPAWQFEYVEGDHESPPVFDTRLGRIGLQVCSEVFSTEASRILALKGAQLILYPAGGALNELLPAWRTLVWARAIENLVFTAAVQNIYSSDEDGVGTIASPERVISQATGPGMLLADLDFDRLEYLRDEDERITFPKPYRTVPGVLRWRQPSRYHALVE